MERSTILLTLFSREQDVADILRLMVKSVQNGLDTLSDLGPLIPKIHCFSCLEEQMEQYEMVPNRPRIPRTVTQSTVNQSIEEQLKSFFTSKPVSFAVENGGPVYLIVGAHGQPTGTEPPLMHESLPQPMSPQIVSHDDFQPAGKKQATKNPPKTFREALPVGDAFSVGSGANLKFITLTAFNDVLKSAFKSRPLKALILHTCSLSTLEAIHEIDHVEQQVACETLLKSNMSLSKWIGQAAAGDYFTGLENVVPPAEGVFSSHRIVRVQKGSKAVQVLTAPIFQYLNELGAELQSQIERRLPEIDAMIGIARDLSATEFVDQVDLLYFSEQLSLMPSPILSPSVSASIRSAIDEIQIEDLATEQINTEFKEHFQGISVFFPQRGATSLISNLPDAFQRTAKVWVQFLTSWTSSTPAVAPGPIVPGRETHPSDLTPSLALGSIGDKKKCHPQG